MSSYAELSTMVETVPPQGLPELADFIRWLKFKYQDEAVNGSSNQDEQTNGIGHITHKDEIPKKRRPTLYEIHKYAAPPDVGVEDLSVNLDHYLYGLPKQDE